MQTQILNDKFELGKAAADCGAEFIRKALNAKGYANIIVATGASQFEMLSNLINEPNIDWSKIQIFHLDEYVNLPENHGAGFRKYLRERFINKLPIAPKNFFPVSEDAIPSLNEIMKSLVIDVAFIGIGENGHIAFNDPPADFNTEVPYITIKLDEACRKQQLGEGWFPTLNDVPTHAVSMSVRQIMKSNVIINTVPDERKAPAVKGALEGEISNLCPASILQTHKACYTFLDKGSAMLLKK